MVQHRNTVDVNLIPVGLLNNQTIALKDVPNPVSYDELMKHLSAKAIDKQFTLHANRPKNSIQVSDGPSHFIPRGSAEINLDQPLIHFYNDVYRPAAAKDKGVEIDDTVPETKIIPGGVSIGGAIITFQRTLRVADNENEHALPPSLGTFEIYNTGDFADKLPKEVTDKGGVFMAMYQREAMWLSFKQGDEGSAVKISVGGVNALTGLPQNAASGDKQDYLAVTNGVGGQMWLDGISVSPGVVRQFVAMPLGQGYTVEGQVTGKEDTGGMQIDVYPKYCSTVSFTNRNANIYKTPRQLGMAAGGILEMNDLQLRQTEVLNPGSQIHVVATTLDVEIRPVLPIPELPRGGSAMYQMMSAPRSMRMSRSAGPGSSALLGLAAGGRITQKINRDPLPIMAYNQSKVVRLHVSIINASQFQAITGMPTPPTPVSARSYIRAGLPWFELYDEHIPTANNASTPTALSNVISIAEMDRQRRATGEGEAQIDCVYCKYEMATTRLVPCGHYVCDNCSTTRVCPNPTCQSPITEKKKFAAGMPLPGMEDGQGIVTGSNHENIIKLKASAKRGVVLTFNLDRYAVSGLHSGET
jgi:hypothetical protein